MIFTGGTEGTISFGGTNLPHEGGVDAFVVKLSVTGTRVWARTLASVSSEIGRGLGVDASGDVFVAGSTDGDTDLGDGPKSRPGGTSDVFIASYRGEDGAHRWSKVLGSANDGFLENERATAVAVSPRGHVLVSGWFYGPADFGSGDIVGGGDADIFVLTLDSSDGAFRWAKAFGSAGGSPLGGDRASSASANAYGRWVVAGDIGGTVDFGEGEIVTQLLDGFVLQLAP